MPFLSKYNLAVEEVKTEFRGKKYDGLVYVPTDDKGGKISTPINALGHRSWCGLYCRTEQDAEIQTKVKPLITGHKDKVLQTCVPLPRQRKNCDKG